MPLHEKIHSGRCCDVEWPILESVVQDYGRPGLEQRRVRIGSGGEGSNRRYGTAVNFERLLFVCHVAIKSDATAAIGMVHRLGLGKVRHLAVGDLWVQHHARSGNIRDSNMSELENPSDAQTKYFGLEQCCATRKRVIGLLSLVVMNLVGWCFVEASISSVITNSSRTPRCMDKSGQEGRYE